MENLQTTTAELGESVHRAAIKGVLLQSGLFVRAVRRKLQKESHNSLTHAMQVMLQKDGRMCSGQTKPKLSCLAFLLVFYCMR